jgi:hypothetical protein
MRWAGHAERMENMKIYNIGIGIPHLKLSLP